MSKKIFESEDFPMKIKEFWYVLKFFSISVERIYILWNLRDDYDELRVLRATYQKTINSVGIDTLILISNNTEFR